ncbi:uncharacterized protein LOC127751898 [Frankliniella occidentalis]|uniref:Uncharacterized protein LOC127751898 n=1 Tax=Frankliniella occidentalis TaxID=133901 RepID=A0A9C6XAA4_FRAOC|nr:uncharacterized protein LOC127751898 [Frankliniella occidentalis]
MVMATIARTTEITEATEIFQRFAQVVKSPKKCEDVVNALDWLAVRFFYSILAESYVHFPVKEWKTTLYMMRMKQMNFCDMNYPLYPRRVLHWTTDFKTTDTLSTKTVHFPKCSQMLAILSHYPKGTDLPDHYQFYIPKVVDYLLRYLQSLVITQGENPLTNSAVELRLKLLKKEDLNSEKHVKASRYIRQSIENTEARILEYYYEANFKRIRRRAQGPAVHLIRKKRPRETWKKILRAKEL